MTQSAYRPVSISLPVGLTPSSGFRFIFYLATANSEFRVGKLRQNKGFCVTGQTLEADSGYPSKSPRLPKPNQEETTWIRAGSGEEQGTAHAAGETLGWCRGRGPGGGRGRPGGRECQPRLALQRWQKWPSPVVSVLLVRDSGTMEGTQEALSGKMRLLFTPAARTSLLMLRLNEAALRALQECQQQQVRLAPNPFFPSRSTRPRPQRATLEKGTGRSGLRRFQPPPSLQVKPARQVSAAPTPDPGSFASFVLSWCLGSSRRYGQ